MHFRCVKPENFGAWLSLVERGIWDAEVAGSSPVAPRIISITSTRYNLGNAITLLQQTIQNSILMSQYLKK